MYPHPALLAFTKMRLEEKAKITAKHALLVNKKLYFMNLTLQNSVHIPSPSLKMSSLFECLCQAGSRIYPARKSVIPVLLGSTASPKVLAPPGGAPLESPALCPAQLATSVPGRVQIVSLFLAPKAPTAPATVSPPQVKTQNLCERREQMGKSCTVVWIF